MKIPFTLLLFFSTFLGLHAQCPGTCTYTYNGSGSTNFTLNGGETLCITGNAPTGLNINFNGSGVNTICISPGVSWTQAFGFNVSGNLVINNYGTFNMNGSYNINGGGTMQVNNNPGATLNTNSTGFGTGVVITNSGTMTWTATSAINNQGTFQLYNDTPTSIMTATATSLFKIGNGNTFENYGLFTVSNLENEEAFRFYNDAGGKITIGRYFYNHGAFLNEGLVETICGNFGSVACEFIVGDKGPGKEYINSGCMKVKGNVNFNGPGKLNEGTLIIEDGNLTINKQVTGTNGRIVVLNGTSTITSSGGYNGTNMKFCDQNTAGNAFDVVNANNQGTTVVYTVDCSVTDCGSAPVCTPPTRTVVATDPTCTIPGKIELTATNGDKYGISKGNTYTGPAYATATAVGTLPILIKGNISHAADSTWTIRVFNADNDCFKDTTVTVKALVNDATVSVNSGFPACRLNGTAYTIKFTKSPSGSFVTAKNIATGAAIAVTGDSVANIPLTVAGVRLIVTNGVCKDSVEVTAPACDKPVGSIGDLIWKDVNDNGLQDLPAETGVAGVKVNLYAAAGGTKTGAVLQTKTTAADGLYLFTGLLAGDYIVEIDQTTLADTCQITAKQNIPSDDTKDSDFNPTTGLSQVITLAPVFNPTTPVEILATNNLTVDVGLVVPCIKSSVTLTAAPVCSPDVQTYSLTFNVTNKVGTVKVDKGVLTGSNPYTVTGIPSGATLKITDSLSAVCKFDTLITGPNCNCTPPLPVLITPSLTACIGDTFPTLKATVVGLATVEWFTAPSGGVAVFTGLNYKPSGTVAAGGSVFYAQARSTDASCPLAISTSRVGATVNAQNCIVEVDLALKKSINTKIAQIGDTLTYTINVFNQLNVPATGVEVTDSIATTVQFVAGSFVASRGSATLVGNVIKWNIGGIAANAGANGDTVTLTYKVKATQEGVHFNTAEISKTNEKDVDSTPGNGIDGEDDIDRQCFTVPIKLCPGEKVQASVPSNLTNVQWFKVGSTTPVASGKEVLLSEVGTYTFTATNQTCPANGCCPIIIEPGVNCCPEEVCVPFTVKKIKKK
ncbi:DUF11 domain-containing protein [Runella sp. CRIBMP]|uniref:SdrD B-like domain-containing protein n=1 Tax=Runella sp. CRIBMP TaxID=2683261 RepID=UPI0014121F4F|nr:SdrD B-like domain-containing protein [Runella sp. CRIBMP]NBB22419.1 DUF11 domain-containing protein [Runella sp. CRIBMP]